LELPQHQELNDWYRALLALRRQPLFQESQFATTQARFDEDRRWLVVERGELAVVANFSHHAQRIPLQHEGAWNVLLHSQSLPAISQPWVESPAHSVIVLGRS
jgi:hypothetical protein